MIDPITVGTVTISGHTSIQAKSILVQIDGSFLHNTDPIEGTTTIAEAKIDSSGNFKLTLDETSANDNPFIDGKEITILIYGGDNFKNSLAFKTKVVKLSEIDNANAVYSPQPYTKLTTTKPDLKINKIHGDANVAFYDITKDLIKPEVLEYNKDLIEEINKNLDTINPKFSAAPDKTASYVIKGEGKLTGETNFANAYIFVEPTRPTEHILPMRYTNSDGTFSVEGKFSAGYKYNVYIINPETMGILAKGNFDAIPSRKLMAHEIRGTESRHRLFRQNGIPFNPTHSNRTGGAR